MSGHGTTAAAQRCQVQPEGVSGSVAAECPRGNEHKTGPAKGEPIPVLYTEYNPLNVFKRRDCNLSINFKHNKSFNLHN